MTSRRMTPHQFKRVDAIIRVWAADGYVAYSTETHNQEWTHVARERLAPTLTRRKPWSAARGVDDGSLGITMA